MHIVALVCILVITGLTVVPTSTGLNVKNLAIGCFKDTSNRDLPNLVESSTTSMTAPRCIRMCQRKGFKFAGLQAGAECWCSESFGRYGKATDAKCDVKCAGDLTKTCGGYWHNFIYTTFIIDVKNLAIGCFKDTSNRDLPNLVESSTTSMTAPRCIRMCQRKGFKFAGLQVGAECWCSQSFGRYGNATDAKCDVKCARDLTKPCGGHWHNSIYATFTIDIKQLAIGCFKDTIDRDLPNLVELSKTSMTVPRCIRMCQWKGYKFAGLEVNSECWCGQSFGKHGKEAENECNWKCSGDKTTTCGGFGRSFIYATSKLDIKVLAIGCFKDTADRDLPKRIEYSATGMTVPRCIRLCWSAGYLYAGLQVNSECFCGQRYGKYGKVSNDECNHDCSGDKKTQCGGSWRNFIYATLLDVKELAIGCFKDTADRDLPKRIEYSATEMTVPRCIRLCRLEQFKYAGLQVHSECFCGQRYGKYGKVSNNECNHYCSGDKTTQCGGTWRNLIFATSTLVKNQQ